MSRLPWFHLHSEARTDKKLASLLCDQFRVWFNLLCFSAEQETRGSIRGYDDDLLAVEVADGDGDLLDATIERLIRLRILERDAEGTLTFINFEKRNYDKPSDTPEATRERKRRQRGRDNADTSGEDETITPEPNDSHADVTPSHALEGEVEGEGDSDGEQDTTSPTSTRMRACDTLRSFGVTTDCFTKSLEAYAEFDSPSLYAIALDFVTYHATSPPKSPDRAWLKWLGKQREIEHDKQTTAPGRTRPRPADRGGRVDPASQISRDPTRASPYADSKFGPVEVYS